MEGETSTLVLPRRWCYLEVALRLQGSTRLMDAAAAEGDARTNQAARHAALTAEESHGPNISRVAGKESKRLPTTPRGRHTLSSSCHACKQGAKGNVMRE